MPRIRTIKPEFFRSRKLSECSVRTRLTFIGLWTTCDDEGRYRYEPELLKADLWPFEDDVTAKDVDADAGDLARLAMICLYEVAGQRYLHVVNWHEHQKINRPSLSRLPECSRSTHGGFPEGSSPRARAQEVEVEVELERERDTAPTEPRSQPTTLAIVSDPHEAPETAQTVLAAYIDWRHQQGINGFDPRTKGQLAKHLGQAFAGGHPPDAIKQGLLDWHHGDQHPATLPSCIDAIARGGQPRSKPTSRLLAEDAKLARWADTMEGGNPDAAERVAPHRGPARRELPRPGPPG